MACCAGKGKSSKGDEIPTEMKEIKVEKFDELFSAGSAALQAAEDLRSGIVDSKSTIISVSGAHTLKTGGLSDGIKCWMWSCCAEIGADKWASFKPQIQLDKEPHFDMPLDPAALSDANKEIYEALKCYVETVAGAAGTVQELTEQLKSCQEKATELSSTAKDECSAAGLGAMDTAKAVAAVASNTKTLATGMTKLTALGSIAAECATDLKDVATSLAGIISEAQKNSTEGKDKGAKTAAEMCEKQHPGEKLDPKTAEKSPFHIVHTENKKNGKKLPAPKGKSSAAAPAADAKAAEPAGKTDAPAAPADVKPEVMDV